LRIALVGDVDVVVAGRQVEARHGAERQVVRAVVLNESACRPIAMFSRPMVLRSSACRPGYQLGNNGTAAKHLKSWTV
jgi:hypothetical protein